MNPIRKNRRGEADSRGHSGDLREQHDRVVGPALRAAETCIAELLGRDGEADRRLAVAMERRDGGADPGTVRSPRCSGLSRVRNVHGYYETLAQITQTYAVNVTSPSFMTAADHPVAAAPPGAL